MENKSHFLSGKTIAVAGGGIAGSAFVAGLRKLWDPRLEPPTIIVLERDSQDIKTQREGYSLSLAGHDNTGGLFALQKLGLLDQVLTKAVSGVDEDGSFKIWGPDWTEHISLRRKPAPGIPTASIRIARKDLRSVLHDSIDSNNMIQWESTCVSVRRLASGRLSVGVQCGAENGLREQECDILVACDGANSKLRGLLRPSDKLTYAGAVLRGALSRFENGLPPQLRKDWGFMVSGTGVSCFFSPVDKHSVVWAVGHLEAKETPTVDLGSVKEAQAVINTAADLGEAFREPFKTIVGRSDTATVMNINAKDKLPFRHEQISEIPLVFIGDSNHALSPFAGYGANLALCDGWDLAEQLCVNSSFEAAVAAYDNISVPRAHKVVTGARKRLIAGHATGLRYWIFIWVLVVVKLVRRILGASYLWRGSGAS